MTLRRSSRSSKILKTSFGFLQAKSHFFSRCPRIPLSRASCELDFAFYPEDRPGVGPTFVMELVIVNPGLPFLKKELEFWINAAFPIQLANASNYSQRMQMAKVPLCF
jgi:hypothetical protein